MPRRNRVDPFGNLYAVPQRGTLMGNRGCLHSPKGEIVRSYNRKEWVTCLLDYRGRHRTIMEPSRYTELFFLDEATSFAAGHRPCGTCRRESLHQFRVAWTGSDADPAAQGAELKRIDSVLHTQRLDRKRQVSHLGDLPEGVFVQMEPGQREVWLWWRSRLLKWSFDGYTPEREAHNNDQVDVVTPWCLVEVLRVGYPVSVHTSAEINRL